MESKVSNVKLSAWDGVKEFPIEQAEALLTIDVKGGSGWSLADDGYELVDGHLTKKAKKGNKKDE